MFPPAPTKPEDLRLDSHGAQLFPAALDGAHLGALIDALADQPADHAGIRLFNVRGLDAFLRPTGPIGAVAAHSMAAPARPVRAILFDKTPAKNWSLAWHQDRVVAVRERIETPGFGPWSRKHGALHVAPPFEVLAGMRTLRIHLDPVPETNAPLLIAPGSHTQGRIAEADVPAVVECCGTATCLADPGDIWAYVTPILHASERATEATHRRVLQVDYAAGELPGGLEWLGV
jgi:hypothetical protein